MRAQCVDRSVDCLAIVSIAPGEHQVQLRLLRRDEAKGSDEARQVLATFQRADGDDERPICQLRDR